MFCACKPLSQRTFRHCIRAITTKAESKRILTLPKQENWKTVYESARRIKRNCLADPDYASKCN
jgi:hypothetical protein